MEIPGTIVRLVTAKGFGFVRRNDGNVQFFFHRSAVEGAAFEALREGQAVRFTENTTATRKGPRADKVVVS